MSFYPLNPPNLPRTATRFAAWTAPDANHPSPIAAAAANRFPSPIAAREGALTMRRLVWANENENANIPSPNDDLSNKKAQAFERLLREVLRNAWITEDTKDIVEFLVLNTPPDDRQEVIRLLTNVRSDEVVPFMHQLNQFFGFIQSLPSEQDLPCPPQLLEVFRGFVKKDPNLNRLVKEVLLDNSIKRSDAVKILQLLIGFEERLAMFYCSKEELSAALVDPSKRKTIAAFLLHLIKTNLSSQRKIELFKILAINDYTLPNPEIFIRESQRLADGVWRREDQWHPVANIWETLSTVPPDRMGVLVDVYLNKSAEQFRFLAVRSHENEVLDAVKKQNPNISEEEAKILVEHILSSLCEIQDSFFPPHRSVQLLFILTTIDQGLLLSLDKKQLYCVLKSLQRMNACELQKRCEQYVQVASKAGAMAPRDLAITFEFLEDVSANSLEPLVKLSLSLMERLLPNESLPSVLKKPNCMTPSLDLLYVLKVMRKLMLNSPDAYDKIVSRSFDLLDFINPSDIVILLESLADCSAEEFDLAASYARSLMKALGPETSNSAIACNAMLVYRYFASKDKQWTPPPLELTPQLRPPFSSYRSTLLKHLPKDIVWRLGIDKSKQPQGPYVFDAERSPGFHQGMQNALQLIDILRPFRMNAFLFLLIHDVAVHGVHDRPAPLSSPTPLRKGYAPGYQYPMRAGDIEKATKKELFKEWEEEKLILTSTMRQRISEQIRKANPNLSSKELILLYQNAFAPYLASINKSNPEENDPASQYWVVSRFQPGDEGKIDEIFNKFYQDAAKATTMDEKYAAAARCCRALLIFHMLPDGNGRAICSALLTLLLDQIGAPPAEFINSYLFEGNQTTAQMVEKMKERIDVFEKTVLTAQTLELAEVLQKEQDAPDYQALMDLYEMIVGYMQAV